MEITVSKKMVVDMSLEEVENLVANYLKETLLWSGKCIRWRRQKSVQPHLQLLLR